MSAIWGYDSMITFISSFLFNLSFGLEGRSLKQLIKSALYHTITLGILIYYHLDQYGNVGPFTSIMGYTSLLNVFCLGYYVQDLINQFISGDTTMIMHHIGTIVSLLFSIDSYRGQYALAVLWNHGIDDTIIKYGKIAKEYGYKWLSVLADIVACPIWMYHRIYLQGMLIINCGVIISNVNKYLEHVALGSYGVWGCGICYMLLILLWFGNLVWEFLVIKKICKTILTPGE